MRNHHGSIIGAAETFEDLQPTASLARAELSRPLPDCIDPITGVASHAMMQSHLRNSLANFKEAQLPFGVLLVRVEGLANFRASLGPEAASSLLRVVARTLESGLWITDFVGRWGEDQFLTIVSGCREEAVCAVRERMRRSLAGEAIEWWGERRSLPVTIGEATAQAADTVESLLERLQRSIESCSAWRLSSTGISSASPGS